MGAGLARPGCCGGGSHGRPFRVRPRCARYGLGRRSLSGGSHTHPGRSIVAAGTGRALRSFRSPPSGRFATFGGKCPQGTRFPPSPPKSIRIARLFPVAQSSRRALAAPTARFAPSQISAFCALPRAALVFAHAFRSLCHLRWQQPTGLALPFGAPSGRFALRATAHRADASLRCRAGGEFAPPAQTFLKHLAEKAGAAGLFRQAERPRRFVSPYTSRPGEWPGTPASPDATARRNSPAPSRSA